MSTLRVIVSFENSELDVNALPRSEKHRIVEYCNEIWKTVETETVKYRTLLEDDGYLYVTPGVFDECRCSDVEARLNDYDDHHFNQTDLPDDIAEKTLLYDEGLLRERKLVGEVHPLFDEMTVRFEIVTPEDKVLEWWKTKEDVNPAKGYKCSSYINYIWFHKAKYSTVPEAIWDYYDFDRMMLDLWRSKECFIIYDDGEEGEGYVRLEETGEKFPVWYAKETDWFVGHPCKDKFYIVY
jgi:hypothetical protein